MPYITQYLRDTIEHSGVWHETPGELNYLFTKLCLNYIRNNGASYQHYNDVIGALESCKLEMYRRAVAPYEDTKIKENGDVYE